MFVTIPIRFPRGGVRSDAAIPALIISSVFVNSTTPAFRNMAVARAAWSTRVPVCEETATDPSRVRPALIAKIGLVGVMPLATSRNARGSLKLSICIRIARVPSSRP